MFGRWCSNQLAGRPCHFEMMNVIEVVNFDQVPLMCLNNERHRLMHGHVVTMAAAVDEATIVHSDVFPFVNCCCLHCCDCFPILRFDLMMLTLVVVVFAIVKYF